MNVLDDATALDTVNAPEGAGASKPKGRKGKARGKGKAALRLGRGSRRSLNLRQKAALCAGGVATGLLGLSVTHLTEAIGALTGSHWALSGLLAVGVDAGMLAAEGTMLLSEDRETKRWAGGYVWVAVAASMALNAFAFSQHAADGMGWAAVALGVLIPGLILALGKFGGKLWLEGGRK